MTPSTPILETVTGIVRRAGHYLLETIHSAPAELKGSNDLVTEADRTSEEIILSALRSQFPETSILSEERGAVAPNSKECDMWVVDPLDGTVNYASKIPFYAVSVALLQNGSPTLGVVYAPAIDELFVATRGGGSFLNGKRLITKGDSSLLRMVATSAGMTKSDFKDAATSYHARLLPHYNRLRLMGSQALHLCYVAAGRLEAALTNEAKLWDDAAGALILEEAGGVYGDFRGQSIFPLKTDSPLRTGCSFESLGAQSHESQRRIVALLCD